MKKRIILYSIITAVIILFTGCTKSQSEINQVSYNTPYFFLNSVLEINILDKDKNNEEIQKQIFEEVQRLEELMTMKSDKSEVSAINANAGIKPVKVSADTYEVIKSGIYYSKLSNKNFDITVGPLVELWGIGTESPKVPTEEEIDKALELIDSSKLILDDAEKSVLLENQGMKIDLGAIAKGYVADKINEILIQNQVNSAIINLGGNVYIHGDKSGEPFRIGIQNPLSQHGEFLGVYKASDKSIVTSGAYERFFEDNGVKYHHILSTKDGYPVDNELISVTIISDKSIDGDALSTSAFALGLKEGKSLIETLEGVDAIFITKDNKIYLTSGIGLSFELSNQNFELVN
jgi:thiamine biosynthesis lipoprotein